LLLLWCFGGNCPTFSRGFVCPLRKTRNTSGDLKAKARERQLVVMADIETTSSFSPVPVPPKEFLVGWGRNDSGQ